MADKKKKPTIYRTPKGVLRYPRLRKPDHGTKDYPDKDGAYKTDLVLSEKAAAKLTKMLKPLYKEAEKEGRKAYGELKAATRKKNDFSMNDLSTPEYDDDDNETGNVIFRFKKKASGTRKDDTKWKAFPPTLFDAGRKPIPKSVDPWGGSEAVVAFTVSPYFIPGTCTAGLKLALDAVQIIDLVQGGERSADDYGFEEEDGYSAPEDDDEDEEDEDDSSSEDEEDEDDDNGGIDF